MEYIPDKVHIDNNNNIYIIGIIVIVIIVLVCFFMNRGDSLPNIPLNNKVKEILNYSLMVHLDDEVSEKRLNDIKEIYKNYDLPINLFKATHWKNDKEELSKYPLNYIRITENNTRPGAYGLAGSFYKCLMKAYNENWPYLLFLEDDAVPILPPNQFNQRFNEVINTLPDNGSGLYNLGFAVYCKTSSNDNHKWIKSHDLNIYKTGTHCLLFGKNMIKIFTEYIKKNGINKPIDHIINDFNIWYWYGDLSSNGMFRGLFKQLYMNCNNSQSLEGPINDSKYNKKIDINDILKNNYYINLKHRKDRNIHTINEFKKIGITNPNRFNAIKHDKGSIGCQMSHIQVLKKAKENNWDYVTIFEDDILFLKPDETLKKLDRIVNSDINWDVIILGGNNSLPYEKINNDCIKVNNCQTRTAYIVKKSYYDTLINLWSYALDKL